MHRVKGRIQNCNLPACHTEICPCVRGGVHTTSYRAENGTSLRAVNNPVGCSPANAQLFRDMSRRQPSFDKCLRRRNGLLIQYRATAGLLPSFLAAAIPSRVRSDMSRRSKWAIPEDVEHQFAGDRGRVDAFLEADQVDVVRLEVIGPFEQLLEGAPEAIESGDAEAVTGASMVDQFRQSRALELPYGDRVDEDANGACPSQPVFLDGDALVSGRHADNSRGCLPCGSSRPSF